MNYKEVRHLECKDGCMYKKGEDCTLTLERLQQHENDETTKNIPCARTYAIIYEMEQQLEKETKEEVLTGEVIPEFKTYAEYKQALDAEINGLNIKIHELEEKFVVVGYMLKVARDTNILAESGYEDIYELAQKEYQIEKSQVSRYMNINDKFSVNGYSPVLEEQYRGFGVSKLAVMLTMPKEITEQITPEYSRRDIEVIQKEIKEEEKVTEIEHMLEPVSTPVLGDGILYKALEEMFRAKPEMLQMLAGKSEKQIRELLAPSGDDTKIVRVPGTGKVSIRFAGEITATSLRNSSDREEMTWEELVSILSKDNVQQLEQLIGEKIEENVEVAPVQQKTQKVEVIERKEPKKNKNTQEKKEWKEQTLHEYETTIPNPDPIEEQQEPENIEESEQQEDNTPIEGQQSIEDMPEVMPKPVMDRRTYEERKESYLNSFEDNVGCAMANKEGGNWELVKADMQDALHYIDLLIELDKMEVEDEE